MQKMNINNKIEVSLDEYLRTNKFKFIDGYIYRCVADILMTQSEKSSSEVEKYIKQSIKINTSNNMQFNLAKDYAFYAELLKQKGDNPKAQEYTNKAIKTFNECGADGWVEKYEKQLSEL